MLGLRRSGPCHCAGAPESRDRESTAGSAVPPAPRPQYLLSSFGFSGASAPRPALTPYLLWLTSIKHLSLCNHPPPSAFLTAACVNMSYTILWIYSDLRLTVSYFPTWLTDHWHFLYVSSTQLCHQFGLWCFQSNLATCTLYDTSNWNIFLQLVYVCLITSFSPFIDRLQLPFITSLFSSLLKFVVSRSAYLCRYASPFNLPAAAFHLMLIKC